MILKNILENTNFENAYSEILKLYPNEKDIHIDTYKQVFFTLKQLFMVISNIEIDMDDEENLILKGIAKPNNDYVYIQSKAWSEWLGMSLSKELASKYTKEEIVAICLYNITYLGYNEKDIKGSTYSHTKKNLNRQNITIDDIAKDIPI